MIARLIIPGKLPGLNDYVAAERRNAGKYICGLISWADYCVPSYAVHCFQCGARGPIECTPELAAQAWNLKELVLRFDDTELHTEWR